LINPLHSHLPYTVIHHLFCQSTNHIITQHHNNTIFTIASITHPIPSLLQNLNNLSLLIANHLKD
jgi:hypothetical protein